MEANIAGLNKLFLWSIAQLGDNPEITIDPSKKLDSKWINAVLGESETSKMKSLLMVIGSVKSSDLQKVESLMHLEDYIENIDNANDLETLGGVKLISTLLRKYVRGLDGSVSNSKNDKNNDDTNDNNDNKNENDEDKELNVQKKRKAKVSSIQDDSDFNGENIVKVSDEVVANCISVIATVVSNNEKGQKAFAKYYCFVLLIKILQVSKNDLVLAKVVRCMIAWITSPNLLHQFEKSGGIFILSTLIVEENTPISLKLKIAHLFKVLFPVEPKLTSWYEEEILQHLVQVFMVIKNNSLLEKLADFFLQVTVNQNCLRFAKSRLSEKEKTIEDKQVKACLQSIIEKIN